MGQHLGHDVALAECAARHCAATPVIVSLPRAKARLNCRFFFTDRPGAAGSNPSAQQPVVDRYRLGMAPQPVA